MSDNIFLIRAVDILWCGDMLLYCGTEDGNVEGGPWLGELAHLHLRVMAPGRHGGSSDRPGRAQEAEPWHLQGSISNGLQTGSGGKQRGQHWEVLDGATGLFNHSIISVNPITWIIESLNHSSNQLINHFIISSFHHFIIYHWRCLWSAASSSPPSWRPFTAGMRMVSWTFFSTSLRWSRPSSWRRVSSPVLWWSSLLNWCRRLWPASIPSSF